ncbi:MAG: hypothetical protein ABIF09_09950 [Gemmatimonadota bacterium]
MDGKMNVARYRNPAPTLEPAEIQSGTGEAGKAVRQFDSAPHQLDQLVVLRPSRELGKEQVVQGKVALGGGIKNREAWKYGVEKRLQRRLYGIDRH